MSPGQPARAFFETPEAVDHSFSESRGNGAWVDEMGAWSRRSEAGWRSKVVLPNRRGPVRSWVSPPVRPRRADDGAFPGGRRSPDEGVKTFKNNYSTLIECRLSVRRRTTSALRPA